MALRRECWRVFSLMLCLSLSGAAQTQGEMNEQACRNYKSADAELNRVYQKILRDYKADLTFIKKLKNAQRAWLVYRDAELAAVYPDTSPGVYGSVNPMCRCTELQHLTESRTEELRRWITGTIEGDVCAGSVRLQKSK